MQSQLNDLKIKYAVKYLVTDYNKYAINLKKLQFAQHLSI